MSTGMLAWSVVIVKERNPFLMSSIAWGEVIRDETLRRL